MTTIRCEFSVGELDLLQTIVTQAISRDAENREELLNIWERIRLQRAYGTIIKRPGTSRTPQSA